MRVEFAKRAPTPPESFEPRMPPRPADVAPTSGVDDGTLVAEHQLVLLGDRPTSPNYERWWESVADARNDTRRRQREWDARRELERSAQWPWQWADRVIAAMLGGPRERDKVLRDRLEAAVRRLVRLDDCAMVFGDPPSHHLVLDPSDAATNAQFVEDVRGSLARSIFDAIAEHADA